MSWQATRSVLQFSKAIGSERLVLLVLAEHADKVSYECICGHATLCDEARMKERNLIYTLKKLETSGELVVTKGNGKGNLTRYKINLPRIEKGTKDNTQRVQRIAPLPAETLHPVAPFQAEEKGAEDCTLLPPKDAADCTLLASEDESKGCNPSSQRVQSVGERVQSVVTKGATGGNACKEEPYLTVEETVEEPAAERAHARESAPQPKPAAADLRTTAPFQPEPGPIDPALAVIQAMTDAVLDRYRTGGGVTIRAFEARVAEQVGQMLAMGATLETLAAFFRQRRKLPGLRYLADDWQEWAANLNHLANGAANGSGAHLGRNGKPMLINPDSLTTKTRRNAYAIQEWIEEGSND